MTKMTGMTGKEFIEFHAATVKRMNDIVKVKNQDYSGGGSASAFNNFVAVEREKICSTEAGFLVRMTDKMSRIKNLINNGGNAVKDESIADTLMDLANYSILMMGYIQSKNRVIPESGVAKPLTEPRRAKPTSKVESPANQMELLGQFLNPQKHEFELMLEQAKKEAYREGHKAGYHDAQDGTGGEFDPKLHVDTSIYGYASTVEMSLMDGQKGHMTILRNKNEWAKDVATMFVKITPIEGGK